MQLTRVPVGRVRRWSNDSGYVYTNRLLLRTLHFIEGGALAGLSQATIPHQ